MNFAAGTVSRAPRWAQRSGLEWVCRIKEEPALWRRYARDGLRAAELVATRVLPAALAARVAARVRRREECHRWRSSAPPAGTVLRPAVAAGAGRRRRLARRARRLRRRRRAASASTCRGVAAVGNEFAATLLVAEGWFGARGGFAVTGAGAAARADLRRLLCDELLSERTAS